MNNYIILSKEELEQQYKKIYMIGQTRGISLYNNIETPYNVDLFIKNEVNETFKKHSTSNKKDDVGGWGGC